MTTSTLTTRHIAARTAVALLGGYAFSWGVIVFGVATLFAAGMEFHDAEHLAYLIGLLVYLGAFLAAFASRDLRRAAMILVGGGALLSGVAWLVQQQLV